MNLAIQRGSGSFDQKVNEFLRSNLLDHPVQSFDRVVVVGRARFEAHGEIEPVGGRHDGGRCVEIDGLTVSENGAINDSLREGAAQIKAARNRDEPRAASAPMRPPQQ